MVMVTIPAFPSLQTTVDGMNSVLDEYCPDCSSGELDLTVDDLAGGQVATKLVAYLQSNPETNYVVFNFGDLEIGVPEALKAAGFEDKVKLIGNGAGPQQFQALIDGGMDAAWVAYPAVYSGWEMVDAALRVVEAARCPTATRRRSRRCRRTSSTPPRALRRWRRRSTTRVRPATRSSSRSCGWSAEPRFSSSVAPDGGSVRRHGTTLVAPLATPVN